MIVTRALATALFGAMLTLPSMCNVYRSDVGKLCDSEGLSGNSLKANRSALFTWMERTVASSEAVILVRDLEGKSTHGISVELKDEARKVGLAVCPLADQAELLAKEEDYHSDIVNLCAGSAPKGDGSIARLEILTADDTERMRELVDWTQTNAKSGDTATIVAKLGATPPRQRGALLRAEGAKVGVVSCVMAATLETPPPPVAPPIDTHQVNPTFVVTKADGAGRNPLLIAQTITGSGQAPINACYATALAATPTLAGKVGIKFALDASGHISSPVNDGSTVKGSLLACILTAVGSVTLATPPETKKGAAKGGVTLQLTPVTNDPGFTATIDPTWLLNATPKHK